MRLCILIKDATNAHALPAEKEGARHRRGEFIDVFDADTRGGFNGADGSPAFYRLYITDWPRTLEDAKRILLVPHYQDDDPDKELVARKKRFIRPSELPPAVLAEFQANRFVEATTAQIKNFLRRRRLNSRDLYDSGVGSDLD